MDMFFNFHICPTCEYKIEPVTFKNFNRYTYKEILCENCQTKIYIKYPLDDKSHKRFISFSNKLMNINIIKDNFKSDEWSFLEKNFDFYLNLSSGKMKPQTTEQKNLISIIHGSSKPILVHECIWFKYISLFSYVNYMMFVSHLENEVKSLTERYDDILLKNQNLERDLNNKNNNFNHINKELEISKERVSYLEKKIESIDLENKLESEKIRNINDKKGNK